MTTRDIQVPPAVRICGLNYRYPDGKDALCGVDLELRPGECVAAVGPNGAGKSTLLLHLNGLLPGKGRPELGHHHDLALAGRNGRRPPSVWIDGIEVNHRTAAQVRRKVGLLFQDPDDQLFCTTVSRTWLSVRSTRASQDEACQIARECLARVGLGDLTDRPPHHLSFGERKRVCLAGVLSCRPAVLVLDAAIRKSRSPRPAGRFIHLIGVSSSTKLIATHDLELVLEICPRTICSIAAGLLPTAPVATFSAMRNSWRATDFSCRSA